MQSDTRRVTPVLFFIQFNFTGGSVNTRLVSHKRYLALLAALALTAACSRPSAFKAPVTKFRDSSAIVIESTKVYLAALNKTERDHYIQRQIANASQIKLLEIEDV
jgi:hypothetical protein